MNPDYPFQPQQQPTPTPQDPNQNAGGYAMGQTPQQQPQQQPQSLSQPQQQPFASQPFPQQQASQNVQMPQQDYAPLSPSGTPLRHANPAKKWTILTFVFIFLTLVAAGGAGWALYNYFDQKDNVDNKVSSAVALAIKQQKETDEKAFIEAEKEPNKIFVGPEDYGRVALKHPKTWSVYEAKSAAKGGTYEAYFSPGVIPPVSASERYALRLTIEDKVYEKVIEDYKSLVENGLLKSSSVTVGEQNGTRLEGNFTKDIRGTAVVLKIRDKTVTLRTDADTFTNDFNALIATVTFNK